MKRKQGISLIVLVITIIVMIILAASVVISLSNTGIIDKANYAVKITDQKQVQDLAALTWAEYYTDNYRGNELVKKVKDRLEIYGITEDKWNIQISNTGISVIDKHKVKWEMVREYDANGLVARVMLTNGEASYEVGSTVNYMPNGVGPTSYKGGWKLLGADEDGRLLLISTECISDERIHLGGEDGYVNALNYLQDAVKDYRDGYIGVSARCVTVEDINKITGYDPNTFTGDAFIDMSVEYYKLIGEEITREDIVEMLKTEFGYSSAEEMSIIDNNLEVTYSWDGTDYPKYSYVKNGKTISNSLLESHIDGFNYYDEKTNTIKTISKQNSGQIITLKNNAYSYIPTLICSTSSKAYQMLLVTSEGESEGYWLASRYAQSYPTNVNFGLYYSNDGLIEGWDIVGSSEIFNPTSQSVRAVVSLATGITLKDSVTMPGTYDIIQ